MKQLLPLILASMFMWSCSAEYTISTKSEDEDNENVSEDDTELTEEDSSQIDEPAQSEEDSSIAPQPEFIFSVDMGLTGNVEPFWFAWEAEEATSISTIEAFPVFDQTTLVMTLESCFDFDSDDSSQSDSCSGKKLLNFADKGEVINSETPLVFRDGIYSKSNVALTLDPLPVGTYQMDLFFHNASSDNVSKFEVLTDNANGQRTSLGIFKVSTGEDASEPTKVSFDFSVLTPEPLKVYLRHKKGKTFMNGFQLYKFFEETEN